MEYLPKEGIVPRDVNIINVIDGDCYEMYNQKFSITIMKRK